MTKEQVRLKAEEIQKSIFNKWADTYDEDGIIKAMLEFGFYIEELTKQRCTKQINNLTALNCIDKSEVDIIKMVITNLTNLCTNENIHS
jgi:hypothetical protein